MRNVENILKKQKTKMTEAFTFKTTTIKKNTKMAITIGNNTMRFHNNNEE